MSPSSTLSISSGRRKEPGRHETNQHHLRNDGVEDKYSVLIRFDDQSSTDAFYSHFNGRRFSSPEVDACHVLYAVDVQYTGSIEHTQTSPISSTEQPACPVCLDRLDQDMSGILTTICNHSFHCSCISKWTDSSCPEYPFGRSVPANVQCLLLFGSKFSVC